MKKRKKTTKASSAKKAKRRSSGGGNGGRAAKGKNKTGLTMADACAGLGGFRFTFRALGVACAWACEIDRFAARVYRANFGDDGANNGPDFKVNVANDVLYCLDAFTGAPYPFAPGDPCNPG